MNVFSSEYSTKLSSLSFYKDSKEEYSTLVSRLAEVIDLPLQVAETLQFPNAHVSQSLDLSSLLPASDFETFKQNYIQMVTMYAERFAPHLQLRPGRQVFSLRLSEEMVANADRVAHVYQEDQYWNKYFNDKYPKMNTIVTAYHSAKNDINNLNDGQLRFLELVNVRGNDYAHIKIDNDALHRLSEQIYNPETSRTAQARRLKLPNIIRKLFAYTSHSLLLGEMYDGLKVEMDEHIESFYQRTQETRQAQFDIFNEWYKQNKIFSREQIRGLSEEAGLFMEEKGLDQLVYPLETAPHVPIGAELYLYESKTSSGTWFANIISPVVDPPLVDGYEDPVIGKVTGYGEGNIISINEFFNVEMNMDLFKATFAQYSDVYEGEEAMTPERQQAIDMVASVRTTTSVASVEITETPSTPQAQATQESISLEDLLARHGIVPQEQAEVAPTAAPLPEEAPVQEAEPAIPLDQLRPSPNGYRVTRTGDNEYSLSTSVGGLELGLNPSQLASRLLETNCIQGTPQIIQIDTDATHMASLTEPFVSMTSYLVM